MTLLRNKKIASLCLLVLLTFPVLTIANPNDQIVTYHIHNSNLANQLFDQINAKNIWDNLNYFSSFPDRYAESENGIKAEEWIIQQIETMITDSHRTDVSISIIPTMTPYFSLKQSSIVVKIGNQLLEPGIVLGAHIDTYPITDGLNKPGADDDGTGTVTLIEVFRSILASKLTFNKPIYFVWYAAEEMGLLGSQSVVDDFQKKKIPVEAVLNVDMTGFIYQNDQTIWLVRNDLNSDLNNFMEELINTYLHKPVAYTSCGYDCGDQVSWEKQGYKAVFPTEGKLGEDMHINPFKHTPQDTVDSLSIDRMTDFAKLAMAFSIELAEPKSNE